VTEGSGDCGLIMANEDQVNFDSNSKHGVTWASSYAATDAYSENNGAANTAAIIAAFPGDNRGNNAAYACQALGEAWYLPSKDELDKMYIYATNNDLIGEDCTGSVAAGVQCLIGGYDKGRRVYWSSTESSGATLPARGVSTLVMGIRPTSVRLSFTSVCAPFGLLTIYQFNNLKLLQLVGMREWENIALLVSSAMI
jgi:hypothetical protein